MKNIIKKISQQYPSMSVDLIAYNKKGQKASLIYDNAQTVEKKYMIVNLQKIKTLWKIISIKEYNDAIDMLENINIFFISN